MPSPPRSPLVALIAVIACGLLPAGASAEKLVVDTLADPGEPACVEQCSLRAAINASNASDGPDEIVFAINGGTIEIEPNPLPAIHEGDVVIDGRTAGNWGGAPVVEIDGTEATEEGGSASGLEVFGEVDVAILGLAINSFQDAGIEFGFGTEGKVCGSYIGTNLAGSAAKPNGTGIRVQSGGDESKIGYECAGAGRNLISGNEFVGVHDEGILTQITGNLIGTNAVGGASIPNEFGGIRVGTNAVHPLIVAAQSEGGPVPNVIAYNEGPGVLTEDWESAPVIVGNSIFSNDGLGIDYDGDPENYEPPTLTSATISEDQVVVKGLTGESGSQEIDFYANEECDPLFGFGEGQTPIDFIHIEGDAGTPFEAILEGSVPPGQTVITATTTAGIETSAATSPFSNCVEAEGIPDPPGPPGPAPQPPVPEPLVLAPSPVPVNTQSVVVETVSGKVLVKVPGSGKFVDLATLTSIPIGSIVDATRGKVRLTSVDAAGVEQSAVFYDGMFRITRQDRSGLVTLRLVGGDFSHCKKARGSSATSSKRKGRQLWGSGKGRFRTEGNFGAAVTRGTIWLTKDQCKGTFIRVRQGKVSVTDFVLEKTFALPAGKGYWAKKNP